MRRRAREHSNIVLIRYAMVAFNNAIMKVRLALYLKQIKKTKKVGGGLRFGLLETLPANHFSTLARATDRKTCSGPELLSLCEYVFLSFGKGGRRTAGRRPKCGIGSVGEAFETYGIGISDDDRKQPLRTLIILVCFRRFFSTLVTP